MALAQPDAPGRPPEPAGYLAPGPFTDPHDLSGRLEALLARAGRDPRALAEAVRSWLVHPAWRGAYLLPEDRDRASAETNLRDLRAMLARVGELQAALGRPPGDTAPLPYSHKLIGNCRDHSVLYAALLRLAGVPARARCGFARYFEAGKWIDHWVVERWDGARWVQSDAQLDATMREALGFEFDPMDVPPGEFVSGGEAWRACREGDDPARYGIFEVWGWDIVVSNLLEDAAALAGAELLPWDAWGLAMTVHDALGAPQLAELDALARATPMGAPLGRAEAVALTDRPGIRLPRIIQSFTGPGPGPVDVDLAPILER
jgi:hypothetical protein